MDTITLKGQSKRRLPVELFPKWEKGQTRFLPWWSCWDWVARPEYKPEYVRSTRGWYSPVNSKTATGAAIKLSSAMTTAMTINIPINVWPAAVKAGAREVA